MDIEKAGRGTLGENWNENVTMDLWSYLERQEKKWCGMRWWSIPLLKTCPSQRSRLSLSMLSMVCCPVLVLTTLVILTYHEMHSILLCHLWCAASRLFVNVADNGHRTGLHQHCTACGYRELTGWANSIFILFLQISLTSVYVAIIINYTFFLNS